MPSLFQQLPTGYYVGGGLYKTYDEALKAAQEFTKKTGYRMYVTQHPSGQGYWVQSGRVSDLGRAQQLAQQWANLGLKYVRPTYTPNTPAQQYQQATQNVFNEIFNRLQQPFQYDPSTDPVFQTASQAAQRQVMEAMNERGILYSTITAERAAQAVGELAAQFMEQAFQRRMAEVESLANLLSPLINQAQFERSFPLAEAELTGRLYGQPTLPAQQNQIAAIIDILRTLATEVPRGFDYTQLIPGPIGQLINLLRGQRTSIGQLTSGFGI